MLTNMEDVLHPADPCLLGLALSHATFEFEVLKNPIQAMQIGRKAFDIGYSYLDELEEDSYKDVCMMLSILRDNLSLWGNDKDYE